MMRKGSFGRYGGEGCVCVCVSTAEEVTHGEDRDDGEREALRNDPLLWLERTFGLKTVV